MEHINYIFTSLNIHNDGSSSPEAACLDKLQKIIKKLENVETSERSIYLNHTIRRELLSLIVSLKDDGRMQTKIIDTAIKILVSLTLPVEYYLFLNQQTIFELNKILFNTKDTFKSSTYIKSVMDHIKFAIESGHQINEEYCANINNALLLLRNFLHIPELKSAQTVQNQIIWNLFTQSIDKVVIYLISSSQKAYWGFTIVQIIALLYKDQHVGNLKRLLNLWLETSLSDSSEDNESNTSPPEQSEDSSPFITSDPTSDSSDGGGGNRKISKKTLAEIMREKSIDTEASSSGVSTAHSSLDLADVPKKEILSQSEDFGYVTQVENQESISTSSNEDDQPLQKHTYQKTRYGSKGRSTGTIDKKELRRKKLVKRSKTNRINMKGLLHHLPTDEDIANILKEFTVDFLLKGYGSLVKDLHLQLLSNTLIQIDTSHFFWLITYFLHFAIQLELDLEHINSVLSKEILSFLVYQGIWTYEELETNAAKSTDLKSSLRRLHLVITGIREFLQGVENYQKMIHLSTDDRTILGTLQAHILEMDDLRSLFLLLLRQYTVNLQSKQYLQDLIITNHHYLLFLDSASKGNILQHLKEFATLDIMKQYGLLLENFKDNGEFVNNCIFTMMHHISGELEHITTLFQPSILQTFSLIWETDYQLCDDWSDLIEYIIHKFVSSSNCINLKTLETPSEEEWTKEEKDNLLNYYNQSQFACDTIKNITQKYKMQKTQASIIHQLLEQNIINENQCKDYIKVTETPARLEEIRICQAEIEKTPADYDIKPLRDYLCKNSKSKYINWLQQVLIDACYVKLVIEKPEKFNVTEALNHPVIYHYALLNFSIPVIPWTVEQKDILKYQSFVLLLHKLGLHLPIDTGRTFVTIPNFWTPEHIFSVAQQLGPIDSEKLIFDITLLQTLDKYEEIKEEGLVKYSITGLKHNAQQLRFTPLPNQHDCFNTSERQAEWKMLHNGSSKMVPFDNINNCTEMDYLHANDDIEKFSASETGSLTSDLTRMCVSDEEEKMVVIEHQ